MHKFVIFRSNHSIVYGKMQTAVVLFLMSFSCVLGRLIVGPKNSVVIAGERMSMECRMGGESRVRKWDLHDTKGVTTTVYTHLSDGGGIVNPNYGVQVNANGSGILFSNSTRMDDAGNYTCITKIDNKSDERFSAQLIVFESQPKCETNLTRNNSESLLVGDFIWMRCSVVFRGFWKPTFEWRQHWENGETGKEESRITAGVEVLSFQNKNVTSTLSVAINSATNGSFISCRISFADYNNSKLTSGMATNLPDFNFTWISDVIRLSFSSVSYDDATVSSAVTAFDVKTSLPADAHSSRGGGEASADNSDSYFILLMVVAGLSFFLVLVVIVAIAFCIHYKRKVSAKVSTPSAFDGTQRKEKRVSTMIYEDIVPYAIGDNYETIDEIEIDAGQDSQGYSGLLSTQTTPQTVYRRMDHCEQPFNDDHDNNPIASEMNVSDANKGSQEVRSENIGGSNVVDSPPYLELSCDSNEKNLAAEKTNAYRNVKTTADDALDENVNDSSNSNNESPTSFTNVNYEKPQSSQLPLTSVQVSPTVSSAYTTLLSSKEPQQINPDIPTADCVTKGNRTGPKPPPRKV